MSIDRRFLRRLRSLDRHELRRVLIVVRGLLLARGEEPVTEEVSLGEGEGKVTYRLEKVRCGKRGCKSCPHGPYWYAYYREGSRLRSHYIGRELPEGAAEGPDPADADVLNA